MIIAHELGKRKYFFRFLRISILVDYLAQQFSSGDGFTMNKRLKATYKRDIFTPSALPPIYVLRKFNLLYFLCLATPTIDVAGFFIYKHTP